MNKRALFLVLLLLISTLCVFPVRANPDTENQYVDGFDSTYVAWTEAGVSPYLDDDDSVNYIVTNVNNAEEGLFSFADTALTTITDVHLWIKSKWSGSTNNYAWVFNQNDDWVGQVAPTSTSYTWYQADIGTQLDYLDTPEEVNAFECYFHFYKIGTSTRTISVTCGYLEITGTTGDGNDYVNTQTVNVALNIHQKTTAQTNNKQELQTGISAYSTCSNLFSATAHASIALTTVTEVCALFRSLQILTITAGQNTYNVLGMIATIPVNITFSTQSQSLRAMLFTQLLNLALSKSTQLAAYFSNMQIISITTKGQTTTITGMLNQEQVTITIVQQTESSTALPKYPIVESYGGIISPIITPQIEAQFLYVPYCQITLTGLILNRLTVSTNIQIKNKQATPITGSVMATITRINATNILSNKTVHFTIPRNNQTTIPLTMPVPAWGNLGIFTEQYFFNIQIEYDGKRTGTAQAYFKPQIETTSFLLEAIIYTAAVSLGIYGIIWLLTNLEVRKTKKEEEEE